MKITACDILFVLLHRTFEGHKCKISAFVQASCRKICQLNCDLKRLRAQEDLFIKILGENFIFEILKVAWQATIAKLN